MTKPPAGPTSLNPVFERFARPGTSPVWRLYGPPEAGIGLNVVIGECYELATADCYSKFRAVIVHSAVAEASLNVVRSNVGEGVGEAFVEGGKRAGLGGPRMLLDLGPARLDGVELG